MRSRAPLLALLLLAPTVAAAPWLQSGHDAARTGASPDAGPTSGDVALVVALPARPASASPPLVHAREVDVLLASEPPLLWRVHLDSARVRQITLPPNAHALASDGERLFVALPDGVTALDAEGERLWQAPFPPPRDEATPTFVRCREPAVGSLLLFACVHTRAPVHDALGLGGSSNDTGGMWSNAGMFVLALDPTTGEERWSWTDSYADRLPLPDRQLGSQWTWVYEPSLIGDVVVATSEETVDAGLLEDRFVGLDAATGAFLWSHSYTRSVDRGVPEATAETAPLEGGRDALGVPFRATGTADAIFLRLDQLTAVEPRSGSVLWEMPLPPARGGRAEGGFALRGDALFVAHGGTLVRIDVLAQLEDWRFELPAGAVWPGRLDVIVANDTVHVHASDVEYAIGAADGRVRWKLAQNATWRGLGEGVLVIVGTRELTVVGSTAASIAPRLAVSNQYPAPRERVVVDLSGTRPGAGAAATEYRADWGDGTTTEWQPDPLFSHAYDLVGERTATFSARNAVGQTASRTVAFDVGGTPPVELNAVQRAFAPENQERTFFLLGLLVTLAGALVAAWRVRRRRTLLTRELAAMDELYARTKEKPATCEAALASARARAHDLLVRGSLDEGQVAVLVRHADELAARLRVGLIEERFGFLTVSLARRLRGILEDGRVTAHERAQFLAAVEEERALTQEQRGDVRRAVEEWSVRDQGAGQ